MTDRRGSAYPWTTLCLALAVAGFMAEHVALLWLTSTKPLTVLEACSTGGKR